MLRCSLTGIGAARMEVGSSFRSILLPHQVKRSVSQWQRTQVSNKLKNSATKNRLSALAVSERDTLKEIKDLRATLATLEKTKDSKEAHERMGELDEDTLDTLYKAITTPDPPTQEELRLEAKRRRRMLDKGYGKQYIESLRGQKTAQRLATLDARLSKLHLEAEGKSETEKETDVYGRVSFLLDKIGVPREALDQDDTDLALAEKEERERVVIAGQALLSNSNAREELLSKLLNLAQVLAKTLTTEKGELSIPMGIATKQEWEALAVTFARADDLNSVQKILEAAEQSGHGTSLLAVMNAAADVFAHKGSIENCQALFSWMTQKGLTPDDYSHHCLVKSFIRGQRLDQALELIHQLEDKQPASLNTYNLVLAALLDQSNSMALRSRAWAVFNRMRLVAHPVPDAPCYAHMIRACAIGVPPPNQDLWKPESKLFAQNRTEFRSKNDSGLADTERALDLFREMTGRYNIRPNFEVYSALISTCVRRKGMYEKGWQLFRNMVEMERHRLGSGAIDSGSFAPTRDIFNALLEGCAKNGDLFRARWILAEMLRSATLRWQELVLQEEKGGNIEAWESHDVEQRRPNERTMSKIFYTYATYSPPTAETVTTKRSSPTVGGEKVAIANDDKKAEVQDFTEAKGEEEDEATMTYKLPVSGSAVLREVMSLMERIKIDYQQKGGLLSSVKPDSTLLNSYIAVLSKHTNAEEQVQQFRDLLFGRQDGDKSLLDQLGVEATGWTYMTILESCVKIPTQAGKGLVEFTREVWDRWIELGGSSDLYQTDPKEARRRGVSVTYIARVWAAMITILAKHYQLDEAVNLVRKFAELYPPQVVTTAKASSSSSSEQQERPLQQRKEKSTFASNYFLSPLRGEEIAHLQQQSTPGPTLDFERIKLLHARLVESDNSEATKNVEYMTWLLRSYQAKPEMLMDPKSHFNANQFNRKATRRFLSRREAAVTSQDQGVDDLLRSHG